MPSGFLFFVEEVLLKMGANIQKKDVVSLKR
jgi:hypothetical protein